MELHVQRSELLAERDAGTTGVLQPTLTAIPSLNQNSYAGELTSDRSPMASEQV
ncbi:MAG TPA: hypothetical protein V6D22_24545 [Candidatus Obscuribacterales bacterium]